MPAKILTDKQLNAVLVHVSKHSTFPLRDYVILMLSFRSGLRVGEIAGLRWWDVCEADGSLREDVLTVPNTIAKKGSGRTLPMHRAVAAALREYLKALQSQGPVKLNEHVIQSLYGNGRKLSGNSLQRYIGRLFQAVGYSGCSSHSGRRTFITKTLRAAPLAGCSIRDVQKMVGHRYMSSTELYLEASEAQAKLIDMI
jgi:integrase/recombinase XerC